MADRSSRISTLRIHTRTWGQITRWVVLSGEADIATRAQLQETLAGLDLHDTESLHLHLSQLEFCDVASLRQLGDFALRARQTGHQVMTCRPSWSVRRVATLLDYTHDLGIL